MFFVRFPLPFYFRNTQHASVAPSIARHQLPGAELGSGPKPHPSSTSRRRGRAQDDDCGRAEVAEFQYVVSFSMMRWVGGLVWSLLTYFLSCRYLWPVVSGVFSSPGIY